VLVRVYKFFFLKEFARSCAQQKQAGKESLFQNLRSELDMWNRKHDPDEFKDCRGRFKAMMEENKAWMQANPAPTLADAYAAVKAEEEQDEEEERQEVEEQQEVEEEEVEEVVVAGKEKEKEALENEEEESEHDIGKPFNVI
jgi:hypothetical protein